MEQTDNLSMHLIVMVNLGPDVGIENAQNMQKKNVRCLDFVHTGAQWRLKLSKRKWFRLVHYQGAQIPLKRRMNVGCRFAATRVKKSTYRSEAKSWKFVKIFLNVPYGHVHGHTSAIQRIDIATKVFLELCSGWLGTSVSVTKRKMK